MWTLNSFTVGLARDQCTGVGAEDRDRVGTDSGRDVIEPRFDVPTFSTPQNKMDGDYSGGARHKQEKIK